jgi:hypothetical protein
MPNNPFYNKLVYFGYQSLAYVEKARELLGDRGGAGASNLLEESANARLRSRK